jgi:hypothetical protein
MPLINFKTNFTSLKFGADQPGGGDSGQPFVQSPIDSVTLPVDIQNIYELNRTSLDFPIRGGALKSLDNGTYTTNAALIDANRIKQFFKSAPQGTAFINKQKGLQLTNPLTQVPNSLQFAGVGLGNAVIPLTWVYNPANTIAQVGVQGNGTHFNRQGVSPNIYESVRQTYQYVVGAPQNNTAETNRLTILKALKLDAGSNSNFVTNSSPVNGLSIDPALVDRLGISTIQSQLFNYPGGPGSTYGVGFTRIFRATNSQGVAISTQPTGNPITGVAYSSIGLTYTQLANQNTVNPASPTVVKLQDFRTQLAGASPLTPDYKLWNIETRYGVGNPGAKDTRTFYSTTGNIKNTTAVDKVNIINPFFFSPENNPWGIAAKRGEQPTDMIKFAFECVSNDVNTADQNQGQSVALIFRAFLEGTISDNNQAEYSTFKYLGRGETFRTYQGVDRSISFSFKIFTQTRQEMQPLYKKLNWLMSQVYPDYSTTYNLMRGNVVRVTIGDYIYRMPGFLENVNVTIDNSNTPWEIVLGQYAGADATNDNDVRQLPHMVTVQCSFKPIMDILPRRSKYGDSYVPLIVNGDNYLEIPTSIITQNIEKPNVPKVEDTPNIYSGGAGSGTSSSTTTPPSNIQPQKIKRKNNKVIPPPVKREKAATSPVRNYFNTNTTIQDNTAVQVKDSRGIILKGGRGATGG